MIKIRIPWIALVSAIVSFSPVSGQAQPVTTHTLAWLLSKHRQAAETVTARHEKLPQKTIYSLQAAGLTGTLTEWDAPPHQSRVEMNLGPIRQITGDNGKTAWIEDTTGHVRILTGPELVQDRAAQSFSLQSYDPIRASREKEITLEPQRDAATGDYILDIKPVGANRQTVYLDPKTFLVSKIIASQGGIQGIVTILGYRSIAGVETPAHLLITYAGLPVKVTASLLSASRGIPIDPAMFAPPGTVSPDFTFLTPTGQGPVTIPFTNIDGEISVLATVNGIPLHLLLDSGAGSDFLTGTAAQPLGLKLSGNVPAVGYGGASATGIATNVTLEIPGKVRIPHEVIYVLHDSGITKALSQNGGLDGVLGYDLFSRFAVTINYQTNTLTLADPQSYTPPPGAIIVPLRLDTRTPTVTASVDNRPPARFLIDTGDNGAIHLYRVYAQQHGLLPSASDPAAHRVGGVGIGGAVREIVTPNHSLRIGGKTIHGIPVAVIGGGGITKLLHQAGGIGDAVLSHFVVTFDDTRNELILQPLAAAQPKALPAALLIDNSKPITTAQILKRHLAALGGKPALMAITSTRTIAEVTTGGMHGTVITAYQAPESEYEDDRIGLLNITQGYNGKVAWQEDSDGNVRLLGPDEIEDLRNQLYFDSNSYVIPGPIAGKIVLRPQREPITGNYVLDALPVGGKHTRIYLSPKTFLIVKEQHKDDNLIVTTTYTDYHRVNGVEFPFAQQTTNGNKRYNISLKVLHIENNVPLPPNLFQEPQPTVFSDFLKPGATSATVPFDFSDGEIALDVMIDGHPCRMFLDSGASGIALSKTTADALHLPQTGYLEAQGYGGSTDLIPVKIDSFEIPGAIRLTNIVAVAIPLSPALTSFLTHPIAGFVGYDLLSRFVVRIDFPKGLITFTAPGSFHPTPADGTPLPAALDNDIPTVIAQLGSLPPARFLVDSGDEADLRLYEPYVNKNALNEKYPGGIATAGGGIGGISTARLTRVGHFTVAGVTFDGVPTDFSTDISGGESRMEAGSIGAGLLSRFVVTFDYPQGRIYFASDPQTAAPFDTKTSGIAVALSSIPPQITVTAVNPAAPAPFSEIHPGDTVLSVDGLPAMQLGIAGVRGLLSGTDGKQSHTLSVRSPQGKTVTVTLPLFDPLTNKLVSQ